MALYPNIYTIPGRLNYNEDKVVRQMEAPIAYKLVLCRMQNYSVTPLAPEVMNVRLYRTKVEEADSHSVTTRLQRIFMHAVVRQLDQDGSGSRSQYDVYPCPERSPMDALIALDVSLAKPLVKQSSLLTKSSHVFLNILPQAIVDPQYLEGVARILAYRYAERLEKLGVSTVELKIIERFNSEAPVISVRLVVENPTGNVVRTHGDIDGMPVTTPYPVVSPFDKKRQVPKAMFSTMYVYDFLEHIEHNLLRQWSDSGRDGQGHHGDHAPSWPQRHRYGGVTADRGR
ncbi:acetyl-CoA carboxylase, putative [Phytophthora infestans T30-4]|uniref:Acetyl-CoA carboxylase, putative n=1 Tax=Phytophthora infestans (strain T30-4) TaxID=403677 RepID=D0NNK4_PHYIT|nr:acetyl-CoA carboxylase, putative [Phytophthora infestans T30-4]EEY62175.1 acetyl-CoA carboxylase, putative [Phytophthora infestans T30-4]|eukprot:XP_002899206.1 acetyl-CoA carboxylase, putative [Phytophthora infestans T30-4]